MKKNSGPIARRYGTALYECAIDASRNGSSLSFEKFADIVRELQATFDKKLLSYFKSPVLTIKEKNELLDIVLSKINTNEKKLPSELKDFLRLMIENARLLELPIVLKDFLIKADEYIGVARATLISANKVTKEGEEDFSSILSSVLRKKIVLETKVDESLRSGFIVKVGNTNVDASLRSRLLNLKESLS
ncbi:ATP synthase F1 subunit delta [Fluviispira multicolorata]|uniref:ATP synthase subunit delta n=1 Tax=Fluviispira multicolorata TaxID=2654512 RepID=A0A833JFA7_9BACT|nr:ATP synthase F1 subunit delta [Fluviispira multicolorata]KAB8030884.1 ATP synthase F1 subunit delta [Fluviispira multicolorata]